MCIAWHQAAGSGSNNYFHPFRPIRAGGMQWLTCSLSLVSYPYVLMLDIRLFDMAFLRMPINSLGAQGFLLTNETHKAAHLEYVILIRGSK